MQYHADQLPAILEQIKDFIEKEIYPLETLLLKKDFHSLMPELDEKRQRVKALGLWAPHLPASLGGLGLSLAEFARVSEMLGRSPLGHYVFNCQAPDIGNMEILITHGSDIQKKRFLLPLVKGEIRSCFAMTEPEHAGSNPVRMSTSAVKQEENYLINGHKWFVTAAEGAYYAIVMAQTNPDADNPHQQFSLIIVPTNTLGYRIVRNIPVMGDEGAEYFTHCEISLENCKVPQSNLLGEEGGGFAIAQERLGPGRIHHCMRWIGICERAFEMMCERALSREIAPGKNLAGQQTIQNWIAECRAEINATRLLVLATAAKIDAEGAYAAREDISLIKFHAAGVLQKVLDCALQVHGALGVTDDLLLAHWFRHERAARIYDGPDEVHKSVVARRILKQYTARQRRGEEDAAAIDQPATVRPGEEIDTERLAAYLKANAPELDGTLSVTQYPNGYSNLTYLIRLKDNEAVLRRPPAGADIKTAHDMNREYRVLTSLAKIYPRVPRPLLYCEDESVIGAPFYMMERVKGIILRAHRPKQLELTPEIMHGISKSFIDNMVELHLIDYKAAGLEDLGRPEGYVQRQVEGWRQRYENARTDDIPEMIQAGEWLAANMPESTAPALIHNDYKYDNLVLDPQDPRRILAVLDWEMATIGDPLMDLGTTLGYWIEPGDPRALTMFGLTALPGNLNRKQLLERYIEKSGREVANPVFYYVFGVFKIAVIVQQIYFRYRQGQSKDERFANLIQVVKDCAEMAVRAIEKERIYQLFR